jgi:Variant SH3 domain
MEQAPSLTLQSALALSHFTPKPEDNQSVLEFKKGDEIEFVDAEVDENGWIRGRIKGGDGRWGRVPATYIEL